MKKSDIYGIIGSAVFCLIVLLLLLFIYMPGRHQPEDEGIMVSFGDSFSGGGSTSVPSVQTPQESQPATATPPTPALPTPSTPDNVMTQEDPSVAIAREEDERKKREQEEADRRRQQEERAQREAEERQREEERRRQEAEARRIAEEQRKQQEAIDRANALGNMFGTNVSDEGSGTGTGSEQRGNPAGRGSSDGNSWSLSGRSLIGTLVKPTYTRNVEGVITISIRVNEQGNVVSASLTHPSTISDERTINAATEAARKTKFSAGKSMVTGTITYNFRLN